MVKFLIKKPTYFILVFTFFFSSVKATTLYSYKTGPWNDLDTWTTDPGGTTLTGSQIPVDGDVVYILSSRTVSLSADVTTANLDITINNGGILDLSTFSFSSGLAALRGTGKLKLASVNFPSATTNTFVSASGGTTEYNNTAAFTFPAAQTDYNNLTLNLSSTAIIATQLSNITLNGDLNIKVGVFQINNSTAARRQLSIGGDVTVYSGSSFTVGTGNTSSTTDPVDGSAAVTGGTEPFVNYYDQNTHRIVVYGDFTNNGTVRFTNQNYPVYDAFPANGAATVYFMGSSNNLLTCNNTTDFYNLVVDKGSDQTYLLSINSSDYPNFRLFGANIAGGENGGENPVLKKALWIRNGTLELFGKVVIPSLSEGTCSGGDPNTDFYIPANAGFIIEGPDVIVLVTADDYTEVNAAYGTSATSNSDLGLNSGSGCSSLDIYGKFQIDDGYISARESGGFIYRASSSGEFIVNGGTLDAKQFRTTSFSSGLTAYRQTGGYFTLRGRLTRDYSGVSSVADLTAEAISTTQIVGGTSASVGTFNIERDDNIFQMTGGTIEILDVCGSASGISRAFEVNSLPAYYSVTGGTVKITPTNGTGTDYDYYVVSSAPLYNLTIDDAASSGFDVILTNIPSKTGVTERLNPPMTVENDLTLANNATLNANNYEVQVGGDFTLPSGCTYTPGTNTTTFNGSGYQTFTGGGTITSGFYELNIDKSADTLLLTGAPSSFTVRDSLIITEGTIDDGGKTINVAGNIYVAGVHTGTGEINLNGSSTQMIEASVFGSPSLNNLELNNASNPGAQLLSDLTANTLTLTANTGGSSVFDIQSYRLTLTGGVVQSTGTLAFSADKMVRTSGTVSGRGLKASISLTGASSPDFLFPVGILDGTTNEYSPFTLLTPGNAGTTSGTLTVIPVNDYHPSVSDPSKVIQFYWKIKSTGFVGADADQMQYSFTYFNTPIPANQNKACYLSTSGWLEDGSVDRNNGIITFSTGLGFLSTDFTSGNQSAFNAPRILYSKASGSWNSSATWSAVSHSGADNANPPNSYDKVIIGGVTGTNHTVTVTANGAVAASVTIEGSYTSDNNKPTLDVGITINNVFNSVSGNGRFVISSANLPTADFGDFCEQDTAVFEYSGSSYTIPSTLSIYPNLHITTDATSDRIKTLPAGDILVNGNLVLSGTSTGNTLRFAGTGGDLTVYGDIDVDNTANLEFDGSTVETLNAYSDINLDYDGAAASNSISVNSGTAAHIINFYGDSIIMGASSINVPYSTLNILDSLNTVVTDGTGSIALNKLVVEKNSLSDDVTFLHNVSLSGTTNSSPKALTLTTGTLILGNASTNIELSSGGADFEIPQDAALELTNGASVSVTGTNTGIFLDGYLSASGTSAIDLGDGATTDTRYIEYSGSGNAEIVLAGNASLSVNSQIRRSLTQTNGVLKFNQSGNAVTTIYGQGGSATRAKFEVVNSGSEFYMSGGSLKVIRGGGNTYGDLYIRPETGSCSGGTITLGSVSVGTQTVKFDANIDLNNLLLDGVGSTNTFQLMVNPLVLNGYLTINTANSIFDANGIDVTLTGDFTNNGSYVPGSNTTTFNGTTQALIGSTVTDFYNLTSEPSTSLTFNYDVTISNNLTVSTGTLSSSTYNIYVGGNLTNNGILSGNSSQGGVILDGSSEQSISGTGTFGRLNLYNASGARLQNNIALNQDLLLSKGILNINQYLLTLGSSSDIVDTVGDGYSPTKMIEPDGVFSNVGIKKIFPASLPSSFTFPLGVSGKYTPATMQISSGSIGYIRINCINDYHPTVLDNTKVLHYYWEVESSGISSFDGELNLHYNNSDVLGDESAYVAARLVIPDGTSWSKASPGSTTDNVDETNDSISFTYSGTNNLSGEYTAGEDAAIPSTVPTYTSISDGDWDDVNIWSPVAPAGGPNGFIVVISAGDSVYTNGNRRFAYKTTINGVLDVGSTYGHNLGTVYGTGRLRVESQILPAGRFTSFLSCTGGILEYSGATGGTIIADRLDTLRCLYFTGSATWVLPDKDLVICDTLKISGATLDNSVNNRQLTVDGTFQRLNSGVFTSGSGAGATVVFAGSSAQALGGVDGEFTGTSKFNNFTLNNSSGLTLNSPLEINGDLGLTDGVITTTSTNILKMLNPSAASAVVPDGGSGSSYIDGPMTMYIYGGNDFYFPLGNAGRYGKVQLLGVQTGTWIAQYYNSAFSDLTVSSPLTSVSSYEYWKINSDTDGKTAEVELRWDPSSDITPLSVSGGSSNIRVAEFDGADWAEKTSTVTNSDNYNGTIKTSAAVSINASSNPQYYTLGAVTSILAKAYFTTLDDVCDGNSVSISFSGVTSGELNYTLDYDIDGVPQSSVNITSLPYSLTASGAGTYQLTGFDYNNGANTGVVDNSTVSVHSNPAQPTITPVDGDPTLTFCEGGSVVLSSSAGTTYLWSTSAATQDITVTASGNYSVQITDANGCTSPSSALKTVTVNPLPTITVTATPATVCYGNPSVLNATGGVSYSWTPSGELDNAAIQSPTYTPATNPTSPAQVTTTFTVTVTDANSCSDDGTVDVTLYRSPETGPEYHIGNTWGN